MVILPIYIFSTQHKGTHRTRGEASAKRRYPDQTQSQSGIDFWGEN